MVIFRYLTCLDLNWIKSYDTKCKKTRVSVQGVKSLGGHFACLCRGFEFYEVKKKNFVIIFQKENGNTFTLFIIFIVKSLQKEQNSTNLLLWPPICRNKSAITPKWFNSLDTNSRWSTFISKCGGTQSFQKLFSIWWNTVISKLFFNLVGHSHYKCGGAQSFLNMVEHIHF